MNSLMKSATTANISKPSSTSSYLGSSQKERTPFRLERNKHKYSNSNLTSDNYDTVSSSSSSASTSKMKRSDLLGTAGSTSDVNSYNKLKSTDSGYYDGNYFKSKYDDLLSDVTTNRHTPKKTVAYTGSSTSRQLRPYKRTDSASGDKHRTAINLYEMLENEEKEKAANGSTTNGSYRRQYSQRKSTGQGLKQHYNDNFSTTDDSSDDFADFSKTERENRRKEIQSLIKKYAQLDDFYGKSSREDLNGNSKDKNNNIDPWDLKVQSPIVIPMKSSNVSNNKPASSSGFNALGKSQTTTNIPHYQSNYDFDSSWYGSNYNNSSKNKASNVVPITTFAQKSTSKSRMSKALSTFVRITTIFILICSLS